MKSLISLVIFVFSFQANAVCQINGTITLRTPSDVYAPAPQKAYRCNDAGVRNASGNRVCIQYFSTVYQSRDNAVDPDPSAPSYLHGQVLILDRNDGELVDMKRLYIGDPRNKPAGSVNYDGDRSRMIANLCAAYERERRSVRDGAGQVYTGGRSQLAHFNVRPAYICSEDESGLTSQARTNAAFNYDLFQISGEEAGPTDFLVPDSSQSYRSLVPAKRNRLIDLANGFVPINRCPQRRGLYYYFGSIEQGCYNILNNPSDQRRTSTISSAFSQGHAGGTFTRVLDVIEQARNAMNCEPSARTATRRSTFLGGGRIGNRYDGTRQ
jgi:hypothetical protein